MCLSASDKVTWDLYLKLSLWWSLRYFTRAMRNVGATKDIWQFRNNCSSSNCDTLSRRLRPVKVLDRKPAATHGFILWDTPAHTENAVMFADRLGLWRWLFPAKCALAWRRSLSIARGIRPSRVFHNVNYESFWCKWQFRRENEL